MKPGLGIVVLSLVMIVAWAATRSASSPRPSTKEPAGQQTPTPSTVGEKAACTLKMTEAPAIYGLKLGMVPAEVLALFPGSELDPELKSELAQPPSRFGTSSFLIRPAKYQSRSFRGINLITFMMLDGRVSSINLGDSGSYYSHVDRFVELIVARTSFPTADQWEPAAGLDDQLKVLKCVDFEVRVFAGGEGLNYVLLQDLVAETKLQERRSKPR